MKVDDKMKSGIDGLVEVMTYEYSCGCRDLKIKGKDASEYDFGQITDFDPDNAPEYGCGDIGFEPREARKEVLEKYGLTPEEYDTICDVLVQALHFGRCSLCE